MIEADYVQTSNETGGFLRNMSGSGPLQVGRYEDGALLFEVLRVGSP